MGDEIAGMIVVLLTFLISAAIYLIPGIVAFMRDHRNKAAIILTNVLFGWTVLGWFIALIWAVTAPQPQISVIQYNPNDQVTSQKKETQ